jgi:hypothetical protein
MAKLEARLVQSALGIDRGRRGRAMGISALHGVLPRFPYHPSPNGYGAPPPGRSLRERFGTASLCGTSSTIRASWWNWRRSSATNRSIPRRSIHGLRPRSWPRTCNGVQALPVGTPIKIVTAANPSGSSNINSITLTRTSATVTSGGVNTFTIPPITLRETLKRSVSWRTGSSARIPRRESGQSSDC